MIFKATESAYMQIKKNMSVTGIKTKCTVLDFSLGLMKNLIKAISKMTNLMAMEYLNGLQELFIREIGKMEKCTERANLQLKIKKFFKAFGNEVKQKIFKKFLDIYLLYL